MRASRGQLIYSVMVALVSLGAMTGFSVWFVQHSIDQNNQALCRVVVTITRPRPTPPKDPSAQKPATTLVGRQLQEYNRNLQDYNKKLEAYNKQVSANLTSLIQDYNCYKE